MSIESKFQIDDKVQIKTLEEIDPNERVTDDVIKNIRFFGGKQGTVMNVFPNAFGSDVNVYYIKIHDTGGEIGLFPENVLKPEIQLTPETDTVFRDILRGI